eukprot:TRINITY_DN2023_c0_g1_i7.p1 TRINITY_DN2023_c0_g1~~TRINITY_DN2023_c0_g1_i7.p1  ORF type:complete len:232 (+),score=42.71 TRINITY_DN2023_c0_g1_i7:313-1008(+)
MIILGIEKLLQTYRQDGNPKSLDAISELVQIESHALAMSRRVILMNSKGPSSQVNNASLVTLCGRLLVGPVQVQAFEADLTTEKIDKKFAVFAPDHSIAWKFRFNWKNQRSMIPKLMEPIFFSELFCEAVRPTKTTTSAEFISSLSQLLVSTSSEHGLPLQVGPEQNLFTISDCDSLLESRLYQQLKQDLLRGNDLTTISPRDFEWFLAFACSYPSDLAFDEVSRSIMVSK